jgi:hypothetical protein
VTRKCPLNCSVTAFTSLISTLHRPHGKHRLYCWWRHRLRGSVFTEPLLRNGLHSTVAWRGRRRKHPLVYCCVLGRVYRAVAWQRVDRICYNILSGKTHLKIRLPKRDTEMGEVCKTPCTLKCQSRRSNERWLQRKSDSCPTISSSFRPSVFSWRANDRFLIISQRDSTLSFSFYGLVPWASPNSTLTSEILNLYISHSTPWTGDRPFARHLSTYDGKNAETSGDSSMLRVVHELTWVLTVQFSPASYYIISLRSKYSPQHPVLK